MKTECAAPATATQEVDRESIRLLAIEHGVRGAARLTGLNEDRVRQWSSRFNWFNAKTPHDQRAVTNVTTRPADAHAEALAHHEGQTRLTLAKYASNAAAAIHKSVHPTRYTKHAKDLASVMATVHRQDEGKGSVQFSLNVLNMSMLAEDQD